MDTPHTLIATAEVARSSGHGADRHLYRRGREARDSPLYILDYSWWARPGGWGRPGNVPRGNIFGRPPDHGRSRSRSRLGNGGSASQTPPPRNRVGRGDGLRPASRQGSGTSTRTRHHDPRPAASAASGKDTNQTSSLGHVSCILCAKYLRRTAGLRVETMTQTEPSAAGDGPRCRARRRSGTAGDGPVSYTHLTLPTKRIV